MNKKLFLTSALLCISALALPSCGKTTVEDEYDKNGNLILNLRNLYFSSWEGGDPYTKVIEKKFKVAITPSSYDYNSWDTQVAGEVNGNTIGDTFHFDLESFNFGNTYRKWARGKIIKPLPDDLSKWPNIKKLIEKSSNINSLKLDGKVYGIPLAYNKDDPSKTFSSFTYVYRRDWLKQADPTLVHDDDTYTWEEFQNIINTFAQREGVAEGNECAIGDVSWGFPSLTNFYKDSPHCYSLNSKGKVVNAFTTDNYIKGLKATQKVIQKGANVYFDQVSNTNNTKAYDDYKAGKMGIYYENLSLGNYSTLRKDIKGLNPTLTDNQLDDRTAFLKVKGEDGKFHLEGSENWFSMTFFNYDISENKQHKILDILNYLLTDEGTKLAIFGIKNTDYTIQDGEIELIEENWPKKSDGTYATKINGAKFLREMVTLNYDTAAIDPFTDQRSYQIVKAWETEMKDAKAAKKLVLFQEPAKIKWLSTNLKDRNTSGLIKEGNDNALKYCYGADGYTTEAQYKGKFNTAKWTDTIAEINKALGK